MLDEQTKRRSDFCQGMNIRLFNGHFWTLPIRDEFSIDPDLDALLVAIMDAEDRADRLRLELAMAILLLNRNYELSPDEISSLLQFPPGDHNLEKFQEDLHGLAVRFLVNKHRTNYQSTADASPTLVESVLRKLQIKPIH